MLFSIMRIAQGKIIMNKKVKLLMDPVANQVIQKLRVYGAMTTTDILDSGINTSKATLYRKLDKMLAENIIEIRETRVVMGQIEKVYQIKEIYITTQSSNDERLETVTMALMNITHQYEQYFQKESADVERDKLFLMNYNIALFDEDYKAMLAEILSVVDKYQNKKINNAPKRNLYFISAPGGTDNEK